MATSGVCFCVFAILVVAAALGNDQRYLCPKSLPWDEYLQVHDGKCYYFYLKNLEKYSQAQKTCKENGGFLANVKTKATNDWMASVLSKSHFKRTVWIGLNDINKEQTFVWSDGTPLEGGWTNWGAGNEHSHFLSGLEDCVALNSQDGYKWHDYSCESFLLLPYTKSFVCEYPTGPVSTAPPVTTPPGGTCPPFVCAKSCGMDGYKISSFGCTLCACNV